MANLTREQILARKMGGDVVTLPDGATVTVRGLSHAEVIEGNKYEDLNERTCYMVSKALTDPKLSYEDALAWSQNGGAGDITTISEKVQECSGLAEGAGKSRVSRARKR